MKRFQLPASIVSEVATFRMLRKQQEPLSMQEMVQSLVRIVHLLKKTLRKYVCSLHMQIF